MRKPLFGIGLVAALAVVFALFVPHPALALGEVQSLSTGNWLLSIFSQVAMYVAEAIGKFVIAILDITIPVMRYQGFTSSPVVSAGWAVVRDVVNMFFVVVLIIIAMGTIFGHSRFQWKAQVPKLMIFAVVINFSKTLCGIMIDFAQVVMLTFANALKDIAGGNFIQLLGLGDIFSLSEKADVYIAAASGTGQGTGPFDYFVASVAAVFMMVWVLAVVIMLLFVLIYRIVMLWILIVVSPLAWFMGGQSVFKSDAYAEWWKNFICYTAIGPVITFFLWLTLAVAGSGFIAANDAGFSSLATGGDLNTNISNVVTKIFEFQRLLSFVIGMAMLMAGFDAAAKICHGVKGPGFQTLLNYGKGVPGQIGGYVSGQARKYGGKALSSGFAGARSTATGLGVGLVAAGAGGGIGALAPTKAGQAARAQGLRNLSKKGWLPTEVSTSLAKSADDRQADLAKQLKEGAEGTFKGASDETKLDYLKRIAAEGRVPVGQESAAYGMFAEAIKNPGMREKMEAAGILGKLYKTKKEGGIGMGDDLKKYLKNTPDAKALDEFEVGRPDITGKYSVIDSPEAAAKLDATALTKDEVRNRLKGITSTVYDKNKKNGAGAPDGGYLTEFEAIERGHRGNARKRALTKGKSAIYEDMSPANLALVSDIDLAQNASAELMAKPGVADRLMASTDSKVWNSVKNNVASRNALMARGAGVDVASGRVLDGAKLDKALKLNGANVMAAIAANKESLRDADGNATELGTYVGNSMNASKYKGLLTQIKKTKIVDRGQYDESIEATRTALNIRLENARGTAGEEAAMDDLGGFSMQVGMLRNPTETEVRAQYSVAMSDLQKQTGDLKVAKDILLDLQDKIASGSVDASDLNAARERERNLLATRTEIESKIAERDSEIEELEKIAAKSPSKFRLP